MVKNQDQFEVLRKIYKSGKKTQRSLSSQLGFSLGKFNKTESKYTVSDDSDPNRERTEKQKFKFSYFFKVRPKYKTRWVGMHKVLDTQGKEVFHFDFEILKPSV